MNFQMHKHKLPSQPLFFSDINKDLQKEHNFRQFKVRDMES